MKHKSIEPVSRDCPVCGAGSGQSVPFLSDSRDEQLLSGYSFASRKVPEFMSHAMVRCLSCDLAYVHYPPSVEELAASYHSADYDSAQEAEDAADAYARAIAPLLEKLPRRESALEIGTGTGAFLERLSSFGFRTLVGIEPSIAAIDAAPEHRKNWIKQGIFDSTNFSDASFDLVCCFMTLEHVRDPGTLVAAARRLLRPGGVFVGVTHNRRAWLNRLLGRRSPIVDVEHMQLFSPRSSSQLLVLNGYSHVGGTSFWNSYRPSYWLRLLPISRKLKESINSRLVNSRFDRKRVPFNVGNYMSWGFNG